MPKALTEKYLCDICAVEHGMIPGIIKTIRKCALCRKKADCSLSVVTLPPRAHRRETQEAERIARCPNCEAEISSLNYTMRGYEYGTADLDGEITDADGTEFDGVTTYTCRECSDELGPSDIIYEDVSEDAPENEESPKE